MKTMPRRARTIPRDTRMALLLLPLAVAASTGCDLAMADYKQKETAEWRKTYELQPGGRVEIINVNGKIDVQPSSGNTVEIVAREVGAGRVVRGRQAGARADRDPGELHPRGRPDRDEAAAQPGRPVRRIEPAGRVHGEGARRRGGQVHDRERRHRADRPQGAHQRGNDQRRHQGARRLRIDRREHDERRRRRGPRAARQRRRQARLHERRHQAAAPVGRQGDDLGPHHERRHRHQRAGGRNDRHPRAGISRGG